MDSFEITRILNAEAKAAGLGSVTIVHHSDRAGVLVYHEGVAGQYDHVDVKAGGDVLAAARELIANVGDPTGSKRRRQEFAKRCRDRAEELYFALAEVLSDQPSGDWPETRKLLDEVGAHEGASHD